MRERKRDKQRERKEEREIARDREKGKRESRTYCFDGYTAFF
jgi:hypothetical protein